MRTILNRMPPLKESLRQRGQWTASSSFAGRSNGALSSSLDDYRCQLATTLSRRIFYFAVRFFGPYRISP